MAVRRNAALRRPADPTTEYSIGIEDHYAWANLVSVTTSGPDELLLDKRRVELLDPQLTASPYHHDTLHMPISEAEAMRILHQVQEGYSASWHRQSVAASPSECPPFANCPRRLPRCTRTPGSRIARTA